jgi:hypothetical protein
MVSDSTRGGVVGQHRGWDGVQVDRPEHRQRQAQQEHGDRDPDRRPDQGAAVVGGRNDADPE